MSDLNQNLVSLLNILNDDGPSSAIVFKKRLSDVGVVPTFRGTADVAPTDESTIRRRREVLIALAKTSLARCVSEFQGVRTAIEKKLAFAQKLRLISALITTALSSGVVASL